MNSKEKKKILFVVSNNLYIRNYISSSALEVLKKNFTLDFLISSEVKALKITGISNFYTYEISKKRQRIYYEIFDLLMWNNRSKSKTFKFRLKRVQGLSFTFDKEISLMMKIIKMIWRVFRFIYFILRNFLFANSITLPIYISFLNNKIGRNLPLETSIDAVNPDLVLFPSSAYDPEGSDLIKICSRKNIPCSFLIDNWDNLSSKTILLERPTHIGVWGQQSKIHGEEIQGFLSNEISILGTPRYEEYFTAREHNLQPPYNFIYVLFVGTALVFDEPSVLVRLNSIIKNDPLLHKLKIVYRPHPWRQTGELFNLEELDYVIIDSQLENAYKTGNRDHSFQPSLSYYPALLSNAEFVMGGLTSMLIEALIFHKRFLGLIHDDGKNFTSMHNVYKNYTHFQGIESMDAVTLCSNLENLETIFYQVWNSRNELNPSLIDEQRQFYYYHDKIPYNQRLSNMCQEIL